MPIDQAVLDDRRDEPAQRGRRHVVGVAFDLGGRAQNLLRVHGESAEGVRRHHARYHAGGAGAEAGADRQVGVEGDAQVRRQAAMLGQHRAQGGVKEVVLRLRELRQAPFDAQTLRAVCVEDEAVVHIKGQAHHVKAGAHVGARCRHRNLESHWMSSRITFNSIAYPSHFALRDEIPNRVRGSFHEDTKERKGLGTPGLTTVPIPCVSSVFREASSVVPGASQTCLRPVGRGVAPTPTNPLILAVGHTKRHRKAKKGGWAKGNQRAKASRTPRAMAKPRFWRPSGEARRARSSGLVIKPVSTRMAGAGTSRRTLK